MSMERMLQQLRETCGSRAAAVVSRDGLVIAGDMPDNISKETFAIMCATILGAGQTAATELRVGAPSQVLLAMRDARIHIFEAGPRALVVVVTPPDREGADIRTALQPLMDEVRREID